MDWSYRLTLHGDVEHECRVTLKGDGEHILWELSPVDDSDEDGETSSCLQNVADFREYGPPEAREYLKAPATVLDALCVAAGAPSPAWRTPVPAEVNAFLAAAEKGNIEEMQRLVREGVPLHATDHHHRGALAYAAETSTKSASEWLLECGADVNARARYGKTVLMSAAARNREDLADLYRQKGADLTLRDSAGKTAWLMGIESHAGGGLVSSLRANAQEDWPRALHLAAWGNHIHWMEGEDWFVKSWSPEMNLREGNRQLTPLQAAVLSWRPLPQAIRWLVENGADLTVVDAEDGMTMLHHAAKLNLPWMIAACAQAGVKVDATDKAGRTALHYALDQNECPRLVNALLDAGASPLNQVDSRLAWGPWLLSQGTVQRRAWSGLCSYAWLTPHDAPPGEDGDPPKGSVWLEFPAEWTALPAQELDARLQQAVRRTDDASGTDAKRYQEAVLLTQVEALKQPAGWPGRKLWAVFPDEAVKLLDRFRDERPREIIADPATFKVGALQQVHREWTWKARDWNARHDTFKLVLRRGTLRWDAYNTRSEQSLARFRTEGPPRSADFYRTLPRDILDELCALIGDSERTWELPCPKDAREERLERWAAAQPPPLPVPPPLPPPPHQSGKWCYARMDIEDRFTTPSGAGGDGEWSCWMEFPAEWCYCQPSQLDQWLIAALRRAYGDMNEKASGPDGGHYSLKRCWPEVLSRAEAIKQPWAERGKVLYSTDEREGAPLAVPDEERRRPLLSMADPENPPQPIPVSPPPLKGRR